MSRYVSETISKQVVERADGICEYCRIAIDDTYFGGEIDHIRSLKHGGKSELDNLALACLPCNRNKGSDLGSISAKSETLMRFFNPRIEAWADHFRINDEAEIIPLTEIGEVTVSIFRFNETERVLERQGLIEIGRYPTDGRIDGVSE